MTDWFLALVPEYGLWLIGFTTFLSCLALPVPASLVMLAGGAFAAAGDLSLAATMAAAFLGAVAGDQTGYAIGRGGAARLGAGAAGGKRERLLSQARDLLDRSGGSGVFLSRWLVSPLGPYVNFIAGATGIGWAGFTIWGAAGEAVWVGLYTGIGYAFAGRIEMIGDIAGNISGFIAAAIVAALLGVAVFRDPARSKPARRA